MIAIAPKDEFTYVPVSDRDAEVQTCFTLRALNMRETIEIEDFLGMRAGEGGYPAGTMNYKVLKKGLRGFQNLRDRDGEVIWTEDANGDVADEVLQRIPSNIRTELANTIWGFANVSEDEVKN